MKLRGTFSLGLVCWLSVSGVYSQLEFLTKGLEEAAKTVGELAKPVEDFISTVLDEDEEDYLQATLSEINKIRSLYGAKPLEIDPELVKGAQAKSDGLSRSRRDTKSATSKYAEIALTSQGSSKAVACKKAVKEIYNKYKNKPAAIGGKRKRDLVGTGSDYATAFVQLVWSGTERLGVGVTETEPDNYIVVLRFSPPADVDVTEFLDNLPIPNIPFA